MPLHQAFIEDIADHTGDIFVRADDQGVIRFVSASVRILGENPESLVGTNGLRIVHPDDRGAFIASIQSALAGEARPGQERVYRFTCAGGGWLWMEGNPRIVRGPDGEVVELVNILRDVTERREAEIAAAAQADLFRSAFEHEGVGKALVGLDGRFLQINPAFCGLVGYPQDRMLELDFQTITHPEDLDADLAFLDRLTRGTISSYRMDKRYIRANGSVVWVDLTVSMIRDEAGAPRFYVAQVQDQTQLRESETALRASEARFRLLAENASDLVMETRPDGVIAYLSPSVNALTGYQAAEIVGRTALHWIHSDDRATVVAAFQEQVVTRGAAAARTIEYRLNTKDGRTIWMESTPRAKVDMATGQVVRVTDAARDVTARKALEARLSDARDEAQAAARVKADFLANMSHEIRTPLTAILGYAALLGARVDLAGEARHHLDRVSGAGQALLALVNDVLDFSKLEAGQMSVKRRPSAIGETLSESLALFEPQAAAKGVGLALRGAENLTHARIDPDRVRQILLNLVGNALKFTEAGAVTVTAAFDAAADRLRVEVADTGPGLDPAQQAMLFQRFSQVDSSSTRKHGGTGLGLAICRGLVEAMDGAIGVTSTKGEGSTFWFEIQAPACAPVEAAAPAAGPAVLPGLRVLVADDNAVNRDLVRGLLQAFDAEVAEACDGVEAVEIAMLQPFDVILMDIRMPHRDGSDAALMLRERAGPNQTAPILAFSADYDLERYGEHAARAFDGIVRKPISARDLVADVARVTAFDLTPWPAKEAAA